MERHEYAKMAALQDRHWWFAAKRRVIQELLARHLDDATCERILEVGVGTGAMVPVLGARGHVVGLDAYLAALPHLRGAAGVAGDALRLPFSAASFDLVGCFDLLYHRRISNVATALAEIVRVLRPRGAFVLTDSACPALYGRHDSAHHGVRRFRRSNLEALCRQAGIEVLHATYFHTVVFPAVAAVRIGARWFGVGAAEGSQSQLAPAPGWLNGAMDALYRIEAPIASRLRLPFGVSVALVGRRDG